MGMAGHIREHGTVAFRLRENGLLYHCNVNRVL